jgi:biopolymer transport protein ExbD
LIEQPISPAVYGLFHPVILLPQSLVERIAPEQLRAVLLHELIHFRRADVWINCAQSLLQIVYWWHPLVWLANARIRRVREEAVDDAVMLALRGDAEHYAPALLEVAKLALNRPLATLGLVGILESRSALQHRVERLMNFTTPGRAGLSFLSALGLAAFSALALPMGEAPPKASSQPAPASRNSIARSHVRDAAVAGLPFDLQAGSVSYYPQSGITIARSNVVIKYDGNTFTADSAMINQPEGTLLLSGTVFCVAALPLPFITFDTLRINFKSGDFQLRDQGKDARRAAPLITIRISAEGTYWLGTNSLDLAQLRVVLRAAKEQAAKSAQVFTVQIGAAETASFGVLVQLLDLCKELGIETVSVRNAPSGSVQNVNGALTSSSAAQPSLASAETPLVPRPSNSASQSSALDGSVIAAPPTNLVYTGSRRQSIMRKLEKIRISRFSCDNEPLADVIRRLAIETRELDPDKQGIVFSISQNPNSTPAAPRTIDPNTGLPVAVRVSSAVNDLESVAIRLKEPLTNVRLADVLEAIATSADKPIKYSIVDYGVVFSPKPNESELHMRSFRVDPNAFFLRLQEAGAVSYSANDTPDQPGPVVVPKIHVGGTGSENWNGSGGGGLKFVTTTNSMGAELPAIIKYFLSLGVDLRPETGKNVFYGDRYGNLLFNATEQDLGIIEAALQTLQQPQINLKVKIVEVGSNTLAPPDPVLGEMLRPKLPARSSSDETNASAPFTLSGILTDPQYRTVLHALKQRAGSDVLNEAQVTTLSGRQAQIQVTDERFLAAAIATATRGSANGGGNTNTVIPSVIPSGFLTNTPIPLGPTVDLIPVLGADGFTIQLTVIPTLVDFTGYDDPGQMIVAVQGANSNRVSTPLTAQLPLPRFRVHQVTVNAIVWDGQTLVLSGPALYDPRRTQEKVPVLGDLPVVGRLFRSETNAPAKKNLLIFVTPTLIDPAGNLIHPAEK